MTIPGNDSSAATIRLFVALHPSAAALDDLNEVVRDLRVSLANAPGHSTRLTRREGWHVTLAFLGDVAQERVGRAAEAVREVAARTVPLRLRLAGGGTFGGYRNPILWVGVDGDLAELRLFAAAMRRALRRARLPIDERPLRPHLTLSRPGSRVPPEDIAADVAALATYAGPEWTLNEVALMRSEILQAPTGPVPCYSALATAELSHG